jgi:hypothetical protein
MQLPTVDSPLTALAPYAATLAEEVIADFVSLATNHNSSTAYDTSGHSSSDVSCKPTAGGAGQYAGPQKVTERAAGAEVAFHALGYREWIKTWAEGAEVNEHAAASLAAFQP